MIHTPILVGIAQLEQRETDPKAAREPLALMIDALEAAAGDAGCPDLLTRAGSIRVIRGRWPYKNPAAVIREALGNHRAETCLAPFGGNFVQATVNATALDIQAGRQNIVLITGAECGNTQAKAVRAGMNLRTDLDWQPAPGTPDRLLGRQKHMSHPIEQQVGIGDPIQMYPIFETALRHHLGESVADHLVRVSELWAGFSHVASHNPHAWLKEAKTAQEIRTHSEDNRPVSFPYPKLMNSNNNVDQAAALIMCSQEKAEALGIPRDKWVYPWTGTDAFDHEFVSIRDNLYTSPAIRIAGGSALELANLSTLDLDHVDVYSCFPIAVQVAARELGLDDGRPLTVTGGLTFAGGPLNSYVMHSIARMAELLRADSGSKGLITANGGFLTKHSFGVYACEPPSKPFQHADLQDEVNATPQRDVVAAHTGDARVEGYTVMYSAQGPTRGHLSAILPDGRRTWANCDDTDTLEAMVSEEYCGTSVRLDDNLAYF